MAEQIKFTNDEIELLKKLQEDYLNVQNKFGQITITEFNLNNQFQELAKIKEETSKSFEEIQQRERELVDKLTEKYGQGTLDPKSGVFTPSENSQ
jgi:hypothetical protein